jgi:hypothetical protein
MAGKHAMNDKLLDELQRLIAARAELEMDAGQAARLQELITTNPQARRLYIQYMLDSFSLHWWAACEHNPLMIGERPTGSAGLDLNAAEKQSPGSPASCAKAPLPIVLDLPTSPTPSSQVNSPLGFFSGIVRHVFEFGRFSTLSRAAAVMLLTIATGVTALLFVSRPALPTIDSAEPVVATLSVESSPLEMRTIRLDSGTTRLTLPKVGHVVIEGPAKFDLIGLMRARLSYGRIKVRVTEKTGLGFVVETPYGEITDLGTEFGVDLTEQGKAGLVVFEGAVDLRVAKKQPAADENAQRLVGGEGVVFNDSGHFDRIGSISTGNVGTFLRCSERSTNGSLPLIVDVSDNLRTSETKKFYEIVPAGLKEDALAYVDRPGYEWNGWSAEGLPSYLIGADYVKPFNNDKVRKELQISLVLSRPAKLYIFLFADDTDSGEVPKWIRNGFRNTGDFVGLDTGAYTIAGLTYMSQVKIGTGPGHLVDNKFSVWETVVKNPGVVVLGPNKGDSFMTTSMYGIAAVELDAAVPSRNTTGFDAEKVVSPVVGKTHSQFPSPMKKPVLQTGQNNEGTF